MNEILTSHGVALRAPQATDGVLLHRLVGACSPLDENSLYCNLLQCTHFAGTSVVGEERGQLLSAVSAYLVPERPDTLFIWQVAVSESARGQGLGRHMINHILARPICAGVTHLETTVTDSNAESWAMFEGIARRLEAQIVRRPLFERSLHFADEHETEVLARIGPLARLSNRSSISVIEEPRKETTA